MLDTYKKAGCKSWDLVIFTPLNLHYIHEVNRTGRFVKWTTQNHHFRFTAGFWSNNLLFYFLQHFGTKKFPSKTQKVHEQKYTIYMDPFWRVNRKIDSLNLKIDSFNLKIASFNPWFHYHSTPQKFHTTRFFSSKDATLQLLRRRKDGAARHHRPAVGVASRALQGTVGTSVAW